MSKEQDNLDISIGTDIPCNCLQMFETQAREFNSTAQDWLFEQCSEYSIRSFTSFNTQNELLIPNYIYILTSGILHSCNVMLLTDFQLIKKLSRIFSKSKSISGKYNQKAMLLLDNLIKSQAASSGEDSPKIVSLQEIMSNYYNDKHTYNSIISNKGMAIITIPLVIQKNSQIEQVLLDLLKARLNTYSTLLVLDDSIAQKANNTSTSNDYLKSVLRDLNSTLVYINCIIDLFKSCSKLANTEIISKYPHFYMYCLQRSVDIDDYLQEETL